MIRSGETDLGPTSPSRRRATLGLTAATWLLPALARAQATAPPATIPSPGPPPGGAKPAIPPPADGQPAADSSAKLKTAEDASNRMTTPVFVNGEGPFNFLVDTGANRSGISVELAAQLKLPPGRPIPVNGIAAVAVTPTVDIQELRVGPFRLKLNDAPTFTRANLGADGLIGLDLLHDRVVTFDFVARKIEVSRRAYSVDTLQSYLGSEFIGTVISARQRFGQLTIIDAVAGHVHMTCFLDTGADWSVGNQALRRAVQAEVSPDKWISANVEIHSVTGQTVPGLVAIIPKMRIGGVDFSSFGLAFADLHTFDIWQLKDEPALLVGMDLLRLFDVVTIDFASRQVVLQKY